MNISELRGEYNELTCKGKNCQEHFYSVICDCKSAWCKKNLHDKSLHNRLNEQYTLTPASSQHPEKSYGIQRQTT